MGGKITVKSLQERFGRPATLIEVGKGPPSPNPAASWFGRVNLRLPHESWPIDAAGPMLPIVQLNLRDAPYVPPSLSDLDVLAVFFGRGVLPTDTPNGDGWLVRAYPNVGALCTLEESEDARRAVSEMSGAGRPIRPYPISYRILARDFPDWPDVDIDIPDRISDNWEDHFGAARGCKLGGWPNLLQAEISWAPYNEHPANPEFVLQIDAVPKANWTCLADTVCYIGRGTGGARDVWAFDWQCD
jgi:hypothetical protein